MAERSPIEFVPGRRLHTPEPDVWMRYFGPCGPLDVAFEDDQSRTIVVGDSLGRLELEWGLLSSTDEQEQDRLRHGITGEVGGLSIVVVQRDAFWRSVSFTVGGDRWTLRRSVRRSVERPDGSVLARFRGETRGWVVSTASPLEAAITTLAWGFFMDVVGPVALELPDGPE